MADSAPNDGEAPVIVGLSDAAMHTYVAAIDFAPVTGTGIAVNARRSCSAVCASCRALLSEAASRSRVTLSVIVALSACAASTTS